MLRIRTLGASVAVLVAGAGMAVAADIPPYGAPPPAAAYSPVSAYNWSGPYLGVIGGYGWGGTTGGATVPNSGWLGGAYAGANFQTDSNLVVGVEGDFALTGKTGTDGSTTVSNPWDATVRGRIGYAVDRFMVYGTGGLAVGQVNATGTISGSATQIGWTAGGGIEAALTQNVTGRVEYRHTSLGTAALSGGSIAYSSNDIMVGVGFKF